jgi:hypothetical protein
MAEFDIGAAYTRADIYELLGVPEEKRHGAWNTGYREWNGEMFIFATVGAGTTSGFDYPNASHPDGSMTWTGIGSSHSGQRQIQAILNIGHTTHIFVREAERGPFVSSVSRVPSICWGIDLPEPASASVKSRRQGSPPLDHSARVRPAMSHNPAVSVTPVPGPRALTTGGVPALCAAWTLPGTTYTISTHWRRANGT